MAAAHLLTCLELLQSRPFVTGAEMAAELGVHPRTARRYVTALQELGIPVAGERGRGGGYRLRPGYRLPPLMLDDDEAAVVVLGLLAAERIGLGAPAARALGKVRRVLPARLRARVDALEHAVVFTAAGTSAPPAGAVVLALAEASGRARRVTCEYTSYLGEHTERELSPFGLVVHGGRWYLAAHDHGRGEVRTFRVDRLERPRLGAAAEAPPPGFDAAQHIQRSLARVPWTWAVEVTLALEPAEAARRLPASLAELEPHAGGGTTAHLRAESLDWVASLLAGLGCAFTVEQPDELRAAVRALADRLIAAVV
jgi:predicted DNA-binding transcriptional regulator YafY